MRRMFIHFSILVFLIISLSALQATGATISVPGDFGSLAPAVAAAAPGDTVLVYLSLLFGPDDRNIDFGGKNLHLIAPAGYLWTTMNCDYSGFGIRIQNATGGASTIDGFTIRNATGNNGAGIIISNSENVTVKNCKIRDNEANYNGGGLHIAYSSNITVEDCIVTSNRAMYRGAGLMVDQCNDVTIRNCRITGNDLEDSTYGGAAVHDNGSTYVLLDYCTVSENEIIGIIQEPLGEALYFGGNMFVENSIFKNNGYLPTQASFAGPTFDPDRFSCCDIFEPTNPDHVEAIVAVNGNFSTDPIFCEDYQLSVYSPCWDGPCGTIGWSNESCGQYIPPGMPIIHNVEDVGNDQGRQVRLAFSASQDASTAVDQYVVFRKVEANKTNPGGNWDFLAVLPEVGLSEYNIVVPTLCDSTIADGLCESTYFIRATTSDPDVSYNSPFHTGYSLDNLAPSIPGQLALLDGELAWEESADTDFDHFTIYGSDTAVLDPDAILLGYTTGTSFNVLANAHEYYLVSATDFSGNEGHTAHIAASITSSPSSPVPIRTSLLGNHPNPFNPATVISYQLHHSEGVSLTIFDLSGKAVRRLLVNQVQTVGRHEVTWNGRDDAGRLVASGNYLYRLVAGTFQETKSMVMLK